MIKIRARILMCCAYVYIFVPIAIFLVGWLKPVIGIPAVILLSVALLLAVREEKNIDSFMMPVPALIILITASFLWVYVSGVGGFYPQRTDWNWRNAILRDLISYSWPVIYPETGRGLVYYLTFFLPAAIAGKILGWMTANVVMLIWTFLGITVCFLLLCRYFGKISVWKLCAILLIFVVWREHDSIRMPLAKLFKATWNYEFSNNNGLLEWVTNQTIVPWIVSLVFLNTRNVRNYAFLGLLLLASAPLPFAGMFFILTADGLFQLYSGRNFAAWLKQVISIQNLLSIVVLVPVFMLFYSANMAASGDSGIGGIGLYMELSAKGIFALVLFWFFNSLFFEILIFKEYKKNNLYWIILVSLLIIPIIQVGTGRDFCMRASIPAVCLMMVQTAEYLINGYTKKITVRYILIIGSLGVFTNSFYVNLINRTSQVMQADSREELFADAVYTLSNKLPYAQCFGSYMNMYLTDAPYDKPFYKLLAKKKRQEETEADRNITEVFLEETDFDLISGYYTFIPLDHPTEPLNHKIMVSNTTILGKNEIYCTEINQRLAVGEGDNVKKEAITQNHWTTWGTNDIDPNQIFSIKREGDFYKVIWNDAYALTYQDGALSWTPYTENNTQLWRIESMS